MEDLTELVKVLGPVGKRRSGYSNGFSNFKKTSYRKKLSVEKKYFDKTYQSSVLESLTGTSSPSTSRNNGVTYISNAWGSYTFIHRSQVLHPRSTMICLRVWLQVQMHVHVSGTS